MDHGIDERFVLEHAGFLRRVVRSVVADADDVVQATWLAALERPPPARFRLPAWLARVALRVAGRMKRTSARRDARERAVAATESLAPTVDSVARADSLRAITEAVVALDEPYRSTLLQRYYEDLSPEEIARRDGVALATVASRLQRARARLKERIEARLGGDVRALLGWIAGIPLPSPLPSPFTIPAGAPVAAAKVGVPSAALTAALATTGAAVMTLAAKSGAVVAAVVVAGAACWWGVAASSDAGARGHAARASAVAPAEPVAGAPSAAVDRTDAVRREEATGHTGPAAASADPDACTLVVHVVFEVDGAPAPNRSVSIYQPAAPPARRLGSSRGDETATATFERVVPGRAYLEADLGGDLAVDAKAGERIEVTLRIPKGYHVRGRVVDRDRQPVAGASIWCSAYFNYTSGIEVAESGADGSFDLPCFPNARYLAAFAADGGPSLLTYVEELHHRLENERKRGAAPPGEDVVEVELVLLGTSAAMHGVVLDPDGRPLEGVTMTVTPQLPGDRGSPTEQELGTGMRAIPPFRATSGADGKFAIAGMTPGHAEVRALHDGCAPLATGTQLRADDDVEVTLRFVVAGVVTGRVKDEKGAPIADADVRLSADYDPCMPSAKSGVDGRFRLEGMPLGLVSIKASHAEYGKGSASVQVVKGVVGECDVVLAAGLVLRGRVVDAEGRPAAGLTVNAHEGSRNFWGQTTTDGDGRFRILNCVAAPLTLEVKAKAIDWQPIVSVADVRAGGEEIALSLGSSVSVRAVVVAPDGHPASAQLTPWLEGASSANMIESDPTNGVIDVQGLAPGRYHLSLSSHGLPDVDLGERVLDAGQKLDLGTIQLQRAGQLRLRVDGRDGAGPFQTVALFHEEPGAAGLGARVNTREQNVGSAPVELAPGDYRVCALGANVAAASRVVHILSDQETVADLEAVPGVACRIEIVLPEGVGPYANGRAWIEGDSFKTWLPWSIPSDRAAKSVTAAILLRPGRHRVVAEFEGGRSGRADLVVVEGETANATVVVR